MNTQELGTVLQVNEGRINTICRQLFQCVPSDVSNEQSEQVEQVVQYMKDHRLTSVKEALTRMNASQAQAQGFSGGEQSPQGSELTGMVAQQSQHLGLQIADAITAGSLAIAAQNIGSFQGPLTQGVLSGFLEATNLGARLDLETGSLSLPASQSQSPKLLSGSDN